MLNGRERTLEEAVVVSIYYWGFVAPHTNIGFLVGDTGRIRCLLALKCIGTWVYSQTRGAEW